MISTRLRSAAVLLLSTVALAACQQQDNSAVSANPDAKPGLSVDAGMLVLPAVSGNPGAAYFAVTNAGDSVAEVAAIHVDGVEKTEMHQTSGGSMAPAAKVPVAPGSTVKFEPGGLHAMLFGIGEQITAGGTAEMTVIFADGDKVSAPLTIKAAGDQGATSSQHGSAH